MTHTEERNTAANSCLAKVAVLRSTDTFVVSQTLAIRINICGKNYLDRFRANRYW